MKKEKLAADVERPDLNQCQSKLPKEAAQNDFVPIRCKRKPTTIALTAKKHMALCDSCTETLKWLMTTPYGQRTPPENIPSYMTVKEWKSKYTL